MPRNRPFRHAGRGVRTTVFGVTVLLAAAGLQAAQLDIAGPAGSGSFGQFVAALPNGNIVVADPDHVGGGAVYLYGPGGSVISVLHGSNAGDHVGSGGLAVLPSGNFVVSSPNWRNGDALDAGAVTWVNGVTGLDDVVSTGNSLVGTHGNDHVGGITVLATGNYVVASPEWGDGVTSNLGAVTLVSGANGSPKAAVAPGNSLVGSSADDAVGSDGVAALKSGSYVVLSPQWTNTDSAPTPAAGAGAATFCSGTVAVVGTVANVSTSLVGLSAGDNVGAYIVELANGNYVVPSPYFDDGATVDVGAVTWIDGSTGLSITGAAAPYVSANNSLIGSQPGDTVGYYGATALANGNYVVSSPQWADGAVAAVGAATWRDGSVGSPGVVSSANSLVGTSANDQVGNAWALANGNYVVTSPNWSKVGALYAGAATLVDGATGLPHGAVTASNSLVGTHDNDQVGYGGVTALGGGSYVVLSQYWNGVASNAGAATWAEGSGGLTGAVSTANSLYGTHAEDRVGFNGVALANGNYVIGSYGWSGFAGAVTWGNGNGGVKGAVSSANSFVGIAPGDTVGSGGIATLSDGNFAVASPFWSDASFADIGAVSWGNGRTGLKGSPSPANSLIGNAAGAELGYDFVNPLGSGNYVIKSRYWNGNVGAITVGSRGGSAGVPSGSDSVIGVTPQNPNGAYRTVYVYDKGSSTLIVMQPQSNLVSLFKPDDLLGDDFE